MEIHFPFSEALVAGALHEVNAYRISLHVYKCK